MMSRNLPEIVVVAALLSSGAWAAANATTTDEPHFLQAANEAAQGGDEDGAVQLYQSAIIYAPGDPIPYEKLAEFYVQNGQTELAHRYFALALDVQPAYAPALQGIALLDLASGDRAGAQAQHEVLLHACGATCPETAQVEKALKTGAAP